MGYGKRSFSAGRMFLVTSVVLAAATQVEAETERDLRRAACVDPSCPEIRPFLKKHYCAESPLVSSPENGCYGRSGKEPKAAEAPAQGIAPKNDRLFFVMPNYLTVENMEKFEPLPTKAKFKLSAKTMTDPVTVSFIGVIALMGQARNSDPSYGQGLRGYAKRYGTFYADTGIGTLMTTSVFPTVLHQDPRYFQLGRGDVWHRVMYSVSRILVTRADSGEVQFNYSEIVGTAVAAGISNTYHPANQRTLGNTLNVWGTDVMLNALCNVAKEFWPDLRRKIREARESELARRSGKKKADFSLRSG